jgi:hypothetical protein
LKRHPQNRLNPQSENGLTACGNSSKLDFSTRPTRVSMIQASSKLPEYPGMTRTLFFDISIVDPALCRQRRLFFAFGGRMRIHPGVIEVQLLPALSTRGLTDKDRGHLMEKVRLILVGALTSKKGAL